MQNYYHKYYILMIIYYIRILYTNDYFSWLFFIGNKRKMIITSTNWRSVYHVTYIELHVKCLVSWRLDRPVVLFINMNCWQPMFVNNRQRSNLIRVPCTELCTRQDASMFMPPWPSGMVVARQPYGSGSIPAGALFGWTTFSFLRLVHYAIFSFVLWKYII